jgi:hypothetical protein
MSSEFDFAKAVQAHLDWKRKLVEAIEGRGDPIDAAVVSCDDRCALGQWIYGAGGRFANYSEHGSLRSSHAGFHQSAGQVARLAQAGQKSEAEQVLNTTFDAASKQTIVKLRAMQNLVQRQAAQVSAQPSTTAARGVAANNGTATTAVARAKAMQRPAARIPAKAKSAGGDGEWTEF